MTLQNYPTLVLNADYRPLSAFPLSIWPWKDAVRALFHERVILVEAYQKTIKSQREEHFLPSIVALKSYVKGASQPCFNRTNVWVRDNYTCQYCGEKFHGHSLTYDHVIPRSKGGKTSWDNIVAACTKCNSKKANRLPKEAGMTLRREPRCPTFEELGKNSEGLQNTSIIHSSWIDYVPHLNTTGMIEKSDGRLFRKRSNSILFPEDMTSEEYWTTPLEE